MGLTDSLIHHSSFRALDAAMSDNLQLPYKYNGHHSPDGHRVEMVIIVKMDIRVVMVVMVMIIIVVMVMIVILVIMIIMVIMAVMDIRIYRADRTDRSDI